MNARLCASALWLVTICATAAAEPAACTDTAKAALQACHHDVQDNYWISIGICDNVAGAAARTQCAQDAADEREDAQGECRDQFDARLEVCGALGEARYNPRIDPAMFVDPADIGESVAPNPYLLLNRGRQMTYRNGSELITVAVTKATKKILGVKCAVIHDIAMDGDEVVEDTLDWLAQDIHGNIWYFGEISQQFEQGELVSLEGSWKAGVDGAKPGLAMEAAPAVGDVYRQEFALGNAEDLGKILSLTASTQVAAGSCQHNCVLTQDFTPLEPGTRERKYYVPGVGLLLDVNPDTGEKEQLVRIRE